jgi:hypothetical protein
VYSTTRGYLIFVRHRLAVLVHRSSFIAHSHGILQPHGGFVS